MQRKTIAFEAPKSKIKFEIKEWINGRESEYIQEVSLNAVKMGGFTNQGGALDVQEIDTATAVKEGNHRGIEMYVAKVISEDGKEIVEQKAILKFILEEIPSEDYEFIIEEIKKVQDADKKK